MSREWTKEERYKVFTDESEIAPLYDKIKDSPYRQKYHIMPVTGLLNDPNGFIYMGGLWHLFYQWCPWGAVHGLKHWYHLVSTDLAHWENVGLCVKPDTDYDNKGVYSGSGFAYDDRYYIFYTGNHRDEDWTRRPYTCAAEITMANTARKLGKPLIKPNPDYTDNVRDPKIVYNEELKKYFIFLGAQTKDKKGRIIAYSSKDILGKYDFAGELKVEGYEDFGEMWECPSVERIDGKDVLIFCPQNIHLPNSGDAKDHNGYIVGDLDYEMLTFKPAGHFHVLDEGFDFYAAQCAANSDRKILSAWMGLPDSEYPTDDEDWSGCLTLPRELHVKGSRLTQAPVVELAGLRHHAVDATKETLPDGAELVIDTDGKDFALRLLSDEDGKGGILFTYDARKKSLTFDRSGLSQKLNEQYGNVRTHTAVSAVTRLRVFIDRSSVEIFVNDGDEVFTSRLFPRENEHHFHFDGKGEIKLFSLIHGVKEEFKI